MSKDVLANDSDISLLSYLHSERQFHARDESAAEPTPPLLRRLTCISVFLLSLSLLGEIPEGIKVARFCVFRAKI